MGHYGKPDCRVAQLPIFGNSWAILFNSKSIFCFWDEFNAKPSIASYGKWIFRNIGKFAKFQNSLNSASGTMHTTNTSEMNNQMNNFRHVVKILPYQQIVTPSIRLQTNPYSMNTHMSYSPQQVHSTATFSGQSCQTADCFR